MTGKAEELTASTAAAFVLLNRCEEVLLDICVGVCRRQISIFEIAARHLYTTLLEPSVRRVVSEIVGFCGVAIDTI